MKHYLWREIIEKVFVRRNDLYSWTDRNKSKGDSSFWCSRTIENAFSYEWMSYFFNDGAQLYFCSTKYIIIFYEVEYLKYQTCLSFLQQYLERIGCLLFFLINSASKVSCILLKILFFKITVLLVLAIRQCLTTQKISFINVLCKKP